MNYAKPFVAAVRSEIGTRYHHQGRCAGVGLDCGGLLIVAAKKLGVTLPDIRGYSRIPEGQSLENAIKVFADRVTGPMEAGDLLLFAWTENPQHVAIYGGEGRMIHSYLTAKRVVEHDLEASWKAKLRLVYRIRWAEFI